MNTVAAIDGECRYCHKIITRKDNLRRHEEETCNKIRIFCDCGIFIRKSSLSRHLKKCTSSKKIEIPRGDVQEPQINTSVQNGNTKCFQIQLQLHVTETDGNVTYKHDKIEVNGINMMLVPTEFAVKVCKNYNAIEPSENSSSNGVLTPDPSPEPEGT